MAKVCFAADVVVTFAPPGGPAPDLAAYGIGFELRDKGLNGLYWWQGDGACGELPNNSELGLKGSTSPNLRVTRTILTCDYQISGCARDDLSFYFAANKRIYTKRLWAPMTDPADEMTTAFTPLDGAQDLGAVTLFNGRFYWTAYDDLGNNFIVYSINTDGTDAQLLGAGQGYKVIKMLGYTYQVSLSSYVDALFLLTSDGRLVRWDLNPLAPPTLVASGVTDFAIRDESISLVPFGFEFFSEIYGTTGQKYNVNNSTLPGTLFKINAAGGALHTLYTATAQNQLTSVAVDDANIYWTQQPVVCPQFLSCSLGDYSIYRQSFPSDNSKATGPVELIGLPGADDTGINLRSDGQWLYFMNGNSIKRFSTQVPPLYINVMADGLEVVQSLQDLNSDVPLIANRTTYVRGYGHISRNYTGKYNWFSTALLHGFRDGIEFPDSPIFPINSVLLTDQLPTLWQRRGDPQHSFLFQLPDSWTQSSDSFSHELDFSMTVNPNQQIPETGTPPFVNDTVSILKPGTLVRGGKPCLVFCPLISVGPSYYAYQSGFNQILQRAFSVMPAEDFNIQWVDDPQGDWDDPFDFTQFASDKATRVFDDAVETMSDMELWNDPYAGQDEHFVGMIHPMANTGGVLGGNGQRPGNALVATMRMTPGRGHSYVGGMTLAHELGHNYGHKHINCGTFPASQQDFDPVSFPCSLGDPSLGPPTATYGFDSMTFEVILPSSSADLMSYSSPLWDSPAYWYFHFGPLPNAASTSARSPLPPLGSSQVLLVRGWIDPIIPAAAFKEFYLVPEPVAPAVAVAASRRASDLASGQPNPYYIRFLDTGGAILSQVALGIKTFEDGSATDRPRFSQYVNFASGARTVQLIQGTQILAERFISANPPVVTVGTPTVDNAAGTVHLNWTASDPDGDPLAFTLQYSADGGANWRALRTDYRKLEITLNTSYFAGSTQGRVRVITSDGVNTAVTTSTAFIIPNHPPRPIIAGVQEGQLVGFGGQDSLYGMALDAQNVSSSNQLNWIVSGPTPLTGTNSRLSINSLSPGGYSATLWATNTVGLGASALLHFSVLSPTIPEGTAPPTLDGLGSDDGYANATSISLPLEDGSTAFARFFHYGSNFYISFAGLKFGGSTPRSVGVRVDPEPGTASAPNSSVMGFFVDETGAPLEEQGDGTNMVASVTPRLGFAADISSTGSNSWGAELRIADSLLGGWNHLAGVMLEHGGAHWPVPSSASSLSSYAPVYFGTNPPPPPASTPFANAGPNLAIPLSTNRTLFLDGSGSFDPQNLSLTYRWTQVSGLSVVLTGTNTPGPSFAANPVSTTTALVFQLIVNNGTQDSLPGQVRVVLEPPPAQPANPTQTATASLAADGRVHARLLGNPRSAYQIQASSDLIRWSTILTRYADYAGHIEFEASVQDTNFPIRFFRASSL